MLGVAEGEIRKRIVLVGFTFIQKARLKWLSRPSSSCLCYSGSPPFGDHASVSPGKSPGQGTDQWVDTGGSAAPPYTE